MTLIVYITCPVCLLRSYHPQDIKEGYCGHCHDWTHGEVTRRGSDEG